MNQENFPNKTTRPATKQEESQGLVIERATADIEKITRELENANKEDVVRTNYLASQLHALTKIKEEAEQKMRDTFAKGEDDQDARYSVEQSDVNAENFERAQRGLRESTEKDRIDNLKEHGDQIRQASQ
jgi:hypothetical protein